MEYLLKAQNILNGIESDDSVVGEVLKSWKEEISLKVNNEKSNLKASIGKIKTDRMAATLVPEDLRETYAALRYGYFILTYFILCSFFPLQFYF